MKGIHWLWAALALAWQGQMWAAVVGGPLAGGDLNNVTYVQSGANISNVLANIRSGQTFEFDTGTNQYAGVVPTSAGTKYLAPLYVSNRVDVTLKGSGNTVLHMTNDGMLFGIYNCSNLVVEDFIFRGTQTNTLPYDASGMATHGLVQLGGTNDKVTFVRCRFENCNYFGVDGRAEDGGAFQSRTRALSFLGCTWFRCGVTNMTGTINDPDGGAGEFSGEVLFTGCVVEKCGRGIEAWEQIDVINQFTVRDSLFRNNWKFGIITDNGHFQVLNSVFTQDAERLSSSSHIEITFANDALIEGCRFTNSTEVCINANAQAYGNGRNLRIRNNTFDHCHAGIAFFFQLGGEISGNTFRFVTNQAIQIAADGALVAWNNFENCGLVGGGGSSPIDARAFAGTNCVFAFNRFERTTGTAPAQWVNIESLQVNYKFFGNRYHDASGAVPLLLDAGVGTIRLASEQILTNSVTVAFTNLNGTGTLSNMANVSVPAHSLTNSDRQVVGYWSGTLANALANTNQFQIVFGSQTVLDTGLQIASNGTWRAGVSISKTTSGTAQQADAWFEWNAAGVPFRGTNAVVALAQTNGIATTLALKHAARRGGAATNNNFVASVKGIEP